MKVLGRRVLVRREKVAEKYGSLYLPEQARQRPQEGVVVEVGAVVVSVKPGDRVLFGRYAGTDLMVNQESCVMLWDEDIMGILEEQETK